MARFSFTFDDGNKSQLTEIYPILKRHKIPATFYVIGNEMNKPGRLSQSDLIELHREGNEIGSHGLTHKVLSSLSLRELSTEIEGSFKLLAPFDVRSISYPYGIFDDIVEKEASRFYESARGYVSKGLADSGPVPNFVSSIDRYNLISFPIEGRFDEFIDRKSPNHILSGKNAESPDTWFIFTMHGPTSVTASKLGGFLKDRSRDKIQGYLEDFRARFVHGWSKTMKFLEEFCEELVRRGNTVGTVSDILREIAK